MTATTTPANTLTRATSLLTNVHSLIEFTFTPSDRRIVSVCQRIPSSLAHTDEEMEEKQHVNKIRQSDFIIKQRFVRDADDGIEEAENEQLVRAGGDDPAIAARQDHHLGHFRFGIQPDEVRREAGLGDRHVGPRVAAASRDHRVVDRREPVEAERGGRQVRFVDGEAQG